jgi:hypothetical protein
MSSMNTKRPMAANAVDDLAKFSAIAKSNPAAQSALDELVRQGKPVIDCAADSGDGAALILNKRLAQFLDGEVTNAKP